VAASEPAPATQPSGMIFARPSRRGTSARRRKMSKLSAEPLAGDAKPPVGNAGGDDHRSRDERAAVREPQPIGVRGGARHHVQRPLSAWTRTNETAALCRPSTASPTSALTLRHSSRNSRQSACCWRRHHRQPHRRVDRAASPQPRPQARRAVRGHQVPAPRPGSNFTASFDAVFQAASARILVSGVQAPRMNAICERLVGTLRREVLDRTLILGEAHLRAVLTEYQTHTTPPGRTRESHSTSPVATVTSPGPP
jgi:hypothetical protein